MSAEETPVVVTVDGFTVMHATRDRDELLAVAEEMRSSVGSHLADLGLWSTHGNVTLEVRGVTVSTAEHEQEADADV